MYYQMAFWMYWVREGYVDAHADQLVQVVSEIVVVDQLDEHFDLAAVVFELGPPFVELLDDVADLSARLACLIPWLRCISAAFSRRRFLFSFFFNFRRYSQERLPLPSRADPSSSHSSRSVSGFWLRSTWIPLGVIDCTSPRFNVRVGRPGKTTPCCCSATTISTYSPSSSQIL